MEWNSNISIGFPQVVSETISVGAGLFTLVGSTVDVPMTVTDRAYTSPIWYTP